MGGWDIYDNQLVDYLVLLSELVNGMVVFYNVMVELGVSEQVIVFMVLDFGCILMSNGDGIDYGWGGNYIVLGGVVQGVDIYGQFF